MTIRKNILLVLLSGTVGWLHAAAVPVTLELKPQDRILILSPHPDDDVLGCAGLIQTAVQKHLPVRVIYLTNGDNYEWAFWLYKKHPVLSSKGMLRMGAIREQEATRGEGVLGVSPAQLSFLGYPDWGTEKIFSEYWTDSRPPFRSMLTKVTAVPYAQAYRMGAPYRGESALADLEAIMKEFKPTKLFVSHPSDGHRDHRAFYLFAQVAVWDLAEVIHPELFAYLVHYPGWPSPKKLDEDRRLEPPTPWAENNWRVLPLQKTMIDAKLLALEAHRTQMVKDRAYLSSFVGTNELFERVGSVRVSSSEAAIPTVSSAALAHASEAEKVEESEVFWRHLEVEGDTLVVHMDVRSGTKMALDHPLKAYAFGYRHDRPFADIPKLRMVIRKNRVEVFNREQPLVDAGIEIQRDGRSAVIRIPLQTLGNPEKIIGSAWSRTGKPPFDWHAWRVVELENPK